jgi:hypothetical protein
MNNNNLEFPEIVVINKSGMTILPENKSQYSLVPLKHAHHLFELAIQELGDTELYSIIQLANELERQTRIITEKGGVTPEQKLQLNYLMMACVADLRAVSTQLSSQLLEILLK